MLCNLFAGLLGMLAQWCRAAFESWMIELDTTPLADAPWLTGNSIDAFMEWLPEISKFTAWFERPMELPIDLYNQQHCQRGYTFLRNFFARERRYSSCFSTNRMSPLTLSVAFLVDIDSDPMSWNSSDDIDIDGICEADSSGAIADNWERWSEFMMRSDEYWNEWVTRRVHIRIQIRKKYPNYRIIETWKCSAHNMHYEANPMRLCATEMHSPNPATIILWIRWTFHYPTHAVVGWTRLTIPRTRCISLGVIVTRFAWIAAWFLESAKYMSGCTSFQRSSS